MNFILTLCNKLAFTTTNCLIDLMPCFLILQCVRKFAVHLYLWGAAKSAVYRERPRTLNELKTAVTAFMTNISQADLQKVFANKIKRIQAWTDARGHHFQHLL
jgi:hypothetical protein